MSESQKPNYDKLHPIIQSKIDAIVELHPLIYNQAETLFRDEDILKEEYALRPREDLHSILEGMKTKVTDMKLAAHRAAYGR